MTILYILLSVIIVLQCIGLYMFWVLPGKPSTHELVLEEDDLDEVYDEAVAVVQNSGIASTSFLQRKFRIGYSKAARIVDMLEENGVVGPARGAQPREVYKKDISV